MHFDALTLACVAHELRQTLLGGRVQNVVMTDERSVGLEIYAAGTRHYLHLCAAPQQSAIYLSNAKLRRGTDSTPPLLLLLRKYVRGSRLDKIVQPDVTERVLSLDFDHAEYGVSSLVVEPMGRLSNLMLLGPDRKIRGILVPVPAGENAQRVLLPNHPYAPPPIQPKRAPLLFADPAYLPDLESILARPGPLWRALMDHLAGVSPTQAREMAWRAGGAADAPTTACSDAQTLAVAISTLWQPVNSGQWQPGVVEEAGSVIGFAPYPLHFRGEFTPTDQISLALARFYQGDAHPVSAPPDAYAGLRGDVAALIRRAQTRIERQLAALAADEPAPGEPESLRIQAEWLLALSSQIQPHQTVLEIPLDPQPLRIQLDPTLSAVEQAERSFDRAARMERAAKQIPRRRRQLRIDGEFLNQLATDLQLAQNQPEIAAVKQELLHAGYVRPSRRKDPNRPDRSASRPIRVLSDEGFAILVGRNARQNEVVTFEMAGGEDLWLHIREAPGAHVVIRSGGQVVAEETIQAAAQLAAYFSSQRGETGVAVAVTRRRHVSRVAGGRPGQVTFRNEETVLVPAQLPEIGQA